MTNKKEFICSQCKQPFIRYPCQVRGANTFCSHKCRHTWQKTGLLGGANPNFGKKWDQPLRDKQSARTTERMKDPLNREKSGGNKGRIFSEESRKKMSLGQQTRIANNGGKGLPHSEESKKKIGIKSKEKFTPTFKENFRRKMVSVGAWIDDKDRADYEIYFKEAQWPKHMLDLANEEDGKNLVILGLWNSFNNLKGLVRDHAFSRRDGFDIKIFPIILRHPANLRLISNSDNIRKSGTSSISIEELIDRIVAYKQPWFEQENCLVAIEEFKQGKRWIRK